VEIRPSEILIFWPTTIQTKEPNVMIKLGVNIDHVATVREARYRGRDCGEPDPVAVALMCEQAGAHGITAHLREDRRHIQDRDVFALREQIRTRLNLEMANVPEIVEIALKVIPDIICLVPERREELTTEGGLDVAGNLESLKRTCARMSEAGIEVSLFIDPIASQVNAAAECGAGFIELHTGTFAEQFSNATTRDEELRRLRTASEQARAAGLQVNAGHGLTTGNVPALLEHVPGLVELNIGHTLVSRAISIGVEAAVKEMLALLN
jgi:pyridoxine 5-phosphate synthase